MEAEAEVEVEAVATLERSQNQCLSFGWDSQHTEDWLGPVETGEAGQGWKMETEALSLGGVGAVGMGLAEIESELQNQLQRVDLGVGGPGDLAPAGSV